jgi:hypothetical protein
MHWLSVDTRCLYEIIEFRTHLEEIARLIDRAHEVETVACKSLGLNAGLIDQCADETPFGGISESGRRREQGYSEKL